MRPYILAETNWKEIREEQIEIAILPWGATEAHNYHLPYATDNYEAESIAAEAARLAWEKGVKAMVLPAIPFGVNTGQDDIAFCMNLNPSTQLAILRDLITVLDRQGVRKLLVVNGHGGNEFKPLLRQLGLEFPRMFLLMTNFFQIGNRSDFFEEKGDHADELETSLMLHIRPDLVRPLDQAGTGDQRASKLSAIREGWAWSERKWSKATVDTGVGNPKKATAEKGAAYFELVTRKISELLKELEEIDPQNRYEDQ